MECRLAVRCQPLNGCALLASVGEERLAEALVWWLTKPEKLGRKAARAFDKADRIGVPAICIWEVATKAHLSKLKFDIEIRPIA
jgi:hypothetical protein